MSYTVCYLNPGATAEVLDVLRQLLPAGWRLLSAAEGDVLAHLRESHFILVPDQRVGTEHLEAAPKLLMIQHQGVGYERIDLAACRARRIPVCLTPEGTSIGVAEHTLLLILALYKQLVRAATGVRQGKWMQWELRGGSFELCGKTLGLVGLGRIGREVARRALAFDARVIYFDPLVPTPDDPRIAACGSLAELVASADLVSLHVPLTSANRNLVDSSLLAQFKSGSVLINTARGGLVDEGALVEALRRGPLAGAALDVLQSEPPDPANPLLTLENVLITPHISAGTRDALVAKMKAAFANMLRRTRGERLAHLVPELADLFEGTAA